MENHFHRAGLWEQMAGQESTDAPDVLANIVAKKGGGIVPLGGNKEVSQVIGLRLWNAHEVQAPSFHGCYF